MGSRGPWPPLARARSGPGSRRRIKILGTKDQRKEGRGKKEEGRNTYIPNTPWAEGPANFDGVPEVQEVFRKLPKAGALHSD